MQIIVVEYWYNGKLESHGVNPAHVTMNDYSVQFPYDPGKPDDWILVPWHAVEQLNTKESGGI